MDLNAKAIKNMAALTENLAGQFEKLAFSMGQSKDAGSGFSKPQQSTANKGKGSGKSRRKNERRSIGKVYGNFKCTSESCGKAWSSIHAWCNRKIFCELCNSNAKIDKFEDENCELDNYYCTTCENNWQSLHSDEEDKQKCGYCGEMATKDPESQFRFVRHYWVSCRNKECGETWEDAYTGKIYSQRCNKCGNGGTLLSTSKTNGVKNGQRFARGRFGGLGGKDRGHDTDGCDMCQALIAQGFAKNCMRKRMVHLEIVQLENGDTMEVIKEAIDDRKYRDRERS